MFQILTPMSSESVTLSGPRGDAEVFFSYSISYSFIYNDYMPQLMLTYSGKATFALPPLKIGNNDFNGMLASFLPYKRFKYILRAIWLGLEGRGHCCYALEL